MFGSIGMPELLIIFTIALIIFGPRKLPELGRSLGKSLGEFKKASNELRNTLEEEIRLEEQRVEAPRPVTRVDDHPGVDSHPRMVDDTGLEVGSEPTPPHAAANGDKSSSTPSA